MFLTAHGFAAFECECITQDPNIYHTFNGGTSNSLKTAI